MNTIIVEEEKPKLKTGYTTGSSATAASKAALLSIINQKKTEKVDILLPKKSYVEIPIYSCEFGSDIAKCSVIKNGGDECYFHSRNYCRIIIYEKIVGIGKQTLWSKT